MHFADITESKDFIPNPLSDPEAIKTALGEIGIAAYKALMQREEL